MPKSSSTPSYGNAGIGCDELYSCTSILLLHAKSSLLISLPNSLWPLFFCCCFFCIKSMCKYECHYNNICHLILKWLILLFITLSYCLIKIYTYTQHIAYKLKPLMQQNFFETDWNVENIIMHNL